MNLVEILQSLSAKGIELWVDGDKLCYEANEDVLTSELLAEIKQYKEEIIYLLQKRTDTVKANSLSHRQKALWFLYQLAPDSAAYNVPYACRLVSNVDISVLQQAAQALIERHSVLRTTYTEQHGEPVQTIQENQQVCFCVLEATNWSQDDFHNWLTSESDRPFDLSNGPVIRFNVLIKNTLTDASLANEVILLMTAHHIVVDFWSLELLVSGLRVFYEAFKIGQEVAFQEQNQQYSAYVQWENQILASPSGERLWNYWRDRLAGELPILNLPTDRPRPPVQTYEGASYPFVLEEKLTHKLLGLAKAEGVTLYTIILAAFQVLLLRYTNQEDILIGSPMANRSLTEFEKIVGYFANPVVLRADLSGNPTFRELLVRVRSSVLGALEHQDYPFPLLVEQLQPLRDPSRSPLFQVALAWDRSHQNEGQVSLINSDGLIVESLTPESKGAAFDLTLTIFDVTGPLKGIWKYNTDLFDADTISRMAGHFQTLLTGIVANPHQQISQLPLLTQPEQQQLVVEWNDTTVEYPTDKCIHQLFEEQAERTPDAVAVVYENQQMTYDELNCRANQLAHYLRSLGVGAEVLIGICVERSVDMVVGLLGILKAGGAYVPLDPEYPTQRLNFMLEDAALEVLLTQQHLVERLPKSRAQLVCLDTDCQAFTQANQKKFVSDVKPSNLAYVIYTSGSTGRPKAVAIEHHSPVALVSWAQSVFTSEQLAGVLASTSICFDLSVFELFVPLCSGGKVILAKNALHLSTITAAKQVTLVNTVPSAIAELIRVNGIPDGVGTVNLAGESLQNQLVQQIYQQSTIGRVFNLYGPSEDTTYSTFTLIEKGTSSSPTIGRPIANTQIYILDSNLQPVPIGVPGELHIGGAGLARGYLNRPQLTQEKFIPNPFDKSKVKSQKSKLYKTGDLARYLLSGNIEYLGRIDNQVKIRGLRIELGEIEAVLSQHPQIHSVVVIARVDTAGEQRLVAYIMPQPDTAPSISDLRQFLKTKLPEYMVPGTFVRLKSLPLTPNGKVDRKALPEPDTNNKAMQASFVPPLDIVEQKLVEIWAEVLKIYPVGIKDNFFDLGGHSLLAVQLMARIEQQFQKNLPLATLFQNSTIEQLATILRQPIDALNWSPLVPIQPNGSKRPFFCVPGANGFTMYLYNLARHLGKEQPFYALESLGLDGESKPYTRTEDMAAYYIKVIQSIQPSGPYLLGGHSFGGMVAFEMATQLRKRGYEVAQLALLDAGGPGHITSVLDVHGLDDAGWLNLVADIFEGMYGKSLNISEEVLKVLAPDEQLNYLKDRLEIANLLPPNVGIKQLLGMKEVLKNNSQAASIYMPQAVYPDQITFFRASEIDAVNHANSEILEEPGLGWNKFSAQPLDIHLVPGEHITMLNEPHVQVLAQQMRICLERSQADDWGVNKLRSSLIV